MSLPVVICIGSSGVVGDSLGPMVADLLKERYEVPAYVYGGLRAPVNGVNYTRYAAFLAERHRESLVIAVDACVGDKRDVGKIKYSSKGLRAGGALNKNLGAIGDIGILGVVAERSPDNLGALMNVPYALVERMSAAIARKIALLVKELHAPTADVGRLPAAAHT